MPSPDSRACVEGRARGVVGCDCTAVLSTASVGNAAGVSGNAGGALDLSNLGQDLEIDRA